MKLSALPIGGQRDEMARLRVKKRPTGERRHRHHLLVALFLTRRKFTFHDGQLLHRL